MTHFIRTLILAVIAATVAAPAIAEEGAKPVQLSLWDPVQIHNRETDIEGFRLSLYGNNADMIGLDLGVVSRNTGLMKGVQWTVVGWVEGEMVGWQNGALAAVVKGKATGLQTGYLFNSAETGTVVQFGFLNIGTDIKGFQLGIVNYVEKMHGLQIGLINIIRQDGFLPVFPIVNWSF